MFRIITLEREFGSGAAAIAAELSRRLGWKLWDQNITALIAQRAKVSPDMVALCDERMDSRLYRLAKVFWRGSYERSLPLADSSSFDTDRMVKMMEQIMQDIATEGNAVVVGRGAPFFLRGRADTFHVFAYAPHDEKIRRLKAIGKSEAEAEELVQSVDRDRIAYIKYYFNADWPTRSLYHMMINTVIGDENVIQTILETMRRLSPITAAH